MQPRIESGYDPHWLDDALTIYNRTDLKRTNRVKMDLAFRNSFAVITCWWGNQLIGCGRVISDGVMYAGIYDVVVDPDFQKKGVGRLIMEALIKKAPDLCIYLTSTFGNEEFYFKLGFRRHLTAMALYPDSLRSSPYLEPEEYSPTPCASANPLLPL